MGKFSNTWSLMKASWQVLQKDKELLLFPFISGIACLLVFASFALPLFVTDSWRPPGDDATMDRRLMYYAVLFLFYFCNYFVIVFFNTAIVACATIRMRGGDPTVADGFRAATSNLALIAGWALVSATVGLVLRILEDRLEKVGRFVAGLLGMAWTVVSFLVIPILVNERKGPITSLKESTVLLKKTWGEQLISNLSFGLAFLLLSIPAFLIAMVGFFSGSSVVMIICLSLAGLYLVTLSMIQSTLQAIFQAALYLYASQNQAPAGFQPELLNNALRRG